MHDGWEIVKKGAGKRRSARRIYVSVNRRGEIALNAEAFRVIGSPATVALLYNAKQNVIGVKLPVSADKHFFRARRYGRGGQMRVVRGRRLLRQFEITVDKTLGYVNPERVEFRGQPMLLLPLDAGKIVRPAEKNDERSESATEQND
jgi:hypothetical protein